MDGSLVALSDAVVGSGGARRLGPLSLSLERGTMLGVVGPNGAGKSTLLAALAAAAPLSAGTRSAAAGSIGVLLQRDDFVPDLPFTVEDVVLFGRLRRRRPGRRPSPQDRAAADAAVAELGLESLRTRSYRSLSGGEQRKVHLARLLAQGADVLLLDEPTAALDPDWQERITALIGDLHVRHRPGVVMVTHDIARLPRTCSRALLLQRGRVLADGAPAAVFTAANLGRLYGCTMEVERRGERWVAFPVGAR